MFTEPGADLVGEAQARAEVAREDRRQQPVAASAFVISIASSTEPIADDRRDRAERLLGRRARVGRHAVEDRRRPVEVGREAVGARAAASRRSRRARTASRDVLVHLRRDAARC